MRMASQSSAIEGKHVLFVAYGDETRASSRLRVYNWIPYLAANGAECRVIPYFVARRERGVIERWTGVARRRLRICFHVYRRILEEAQWADLVVIQEALLPKFLLRRLRKSVHRMVYDFSDPVHMSAPADSQLGSIMHKAFAGPRFRSTLKLADEAIVENTVLGDLAESLRCPTRVLPGPIDVQRFRPRSDRHLGDMLTIGWLGTNGTYSQLEPLLPVIDEIGRRHGQARLVLLGTSAQPRLNHTSVENHRWSLQTEANVLVDCDIAVCHLKMTPWTRARGGSKLIAYMAAGVPIVSSPAGIGDQVVHPDCGILADTERDWKEALLQLAFDKALRQKMGTNARRRAVKMYSYEAQLKPFLRALGWVRDTVIVRAAA